MDAFAMAADLFDPPPPKWSTPGDMARALDGRTVQTAALELIDKALVDAARTPDSRLIISMPPQEGKSQRASRRFPLWMLTQRHDTRIAICSYESSVARRWGRAIRDDVKQHTSELALSIREDLSAQHEWQLDGHEGGVFTAGVGGGLTGRPVDLMIIDDPIKDRQQADSKVYRDAVWDWWTDVASTRLAPGAPVILILTRWHHDDLAGRLLAAEDGHLWKEVNIPALADHRPEKGETDPLGRAPGEYLDSARGRTRKQWDAIKLRSGPRTWNALYQGRPTPNQGGLFPADKWARYDAKMWVVREDGTRWLPGEPEVAQSWDMTFKDADGTDYVVGQVWARYGTKLYLVDQVRDRMGFTATVEAVKTMTARWPQAVAKFIEDKANGPAVINALQRMVLGLVPIEPEGSKYARAEAIHPLVAAGDVVLPDSLIDGCAWVTDLTEEAAAFPNGKHDDQIDALTQAANRMLLNPLLDTSAFDDGDDLYEYERRQAISPY